jgi:class 3 adenylate cyclase
MADIQSLFGVLRQSADAGFCDVIQKFVASAPDHRLVNVNALAFASGHKLDEEQTIAGFLHTCRLGLFDLSWNVLCPGCGGVLDANTSLKTVESDAYTCALCAAGYEPTLDEMVEVTFTVSPRLRRIAAHNPHELPPYEYFRQIYWGSGIDLPDEKYNEMVDEFMLEALELASGEKATISLQLPEAFIIVFEPVTHAAQFIDVKGEPTRERQTLSLVIDRGHRHHETLTMRPGPLRISFENKTEVRVVPSVCVANDALHDVLGKRRPFLTAKRILSNQTFRDIFQTGTLSTDQRLKITSLTFLFTDLRGSTMLYDRVGDLAAYELVRAHFTDLGRIVGRHGGAVVKTIGDAVMATFPTPDRAVAAALAIQDAMKANGDLVIKIGLHEGPCIAVNMNDKQDYFGQTVNIASRVQSIALPEYVYVTDAVYNSSERVLAEAGREIVRHEASLRGIGKDMPVFAIAPGR